MFELFNDSLIMLKRKTERGEKINYRIGSKALNRIDDRIYTYSFFCPF